MLDGPCGSQFQSFWIWIEMNCHHVRPWWLFSFGYPSSSENLSAEHGPERVCLFRRYTQMAIGNKPRKAIGFWGRQPLYIVHSFCRPLVPEPWWQSEAQKVPTPGTPSSWFGTILGTWFPKFQVIPPAPRTNLDSNEQPMFRGKTCLLTPVIGKVSGLVAAGANILILSELPGDPSEKAPQGVNFFELSFHIQRFLLQQLGIRTPSYPSSYG